MIPMLSTKPRRCSVTSLRSPRNVTMPIGSPVTSSGACHQNGISTPYSSPAARARVAASWLISRYSASSGSRAFRVLPFGQCLRLDVEMQAVEAGRRSHRRVVGDHRVHNRQHRAMLRGARELRVAIEGVHAHPAAMRFGDQRGPLRPRVELPVRSRSACRDLHRDDVDAVCLTEFEEGPPLAGIAEQRRRLPDPQAAIRLRPSAGCCKQRRQQKNGCDAAEMFQKCAVR